MRPISDQDRPLIHNFSKQLSLHIKGKNTPADMVNVEQMRIYSDFSRLTVDSIKPCPRSLELRFSQPKRKNIVENLSHSNVRFTVHNELEGEINSAATAVVAEMQDTTHVEELTEKISRSILDGIQSNFRADVDDIKAIYSARLCKHGADLKIDFGPIDARSQRTITAQHDKAQELFPRLLSNMKTVVRDGIYAIIAQKPQIFYIAPNPPASRRLPNTPYELQPGRIREKGGRPVSNPMQLALNKVYCKARYYGMLEGLRTTGDAIVPPAILGVGVATTGVISGHRWPGIIGGTATVIARMAHVLARDSALMSAGLHRTLMQHDQNLAICKPDSGEAKARRTIAQALGTNGAMDFERWASTKGTMSIGDAFNEAKALREKFNHHLTLASEIDALEKEREKLEKVRWFKSRPSSATLDRIKAINSRIMIAEDERLAISQSLTNGDSATGEADAIGIRSLSHVRNVEFDEDEELFKSMATVRTAFIEHPLLDTAEQVHEYAKAYFLENCPNSAARYS